MFERLEPRVLLSHTPGLDHALYMPEGFSAPTVVEAVELALTDDSGSADWELWAHYERAGSGEEAAPIASGTLAAGERDRVAVWGEGAALVRPDEPYSLVLRSSSDDLAALLRHSDFGAQTAQHFTPDTALGFTLADLTRGADRRGFVVFFNPGDDPAEVELELEHEDGGVRVLRTTVDGQRRGGWNLAEVPGLDDGGYTARVRSDAAIVLGGTRYDLDDRAATIELPGQGPALAGAILHPEFDGGTSPGDDTTIRLANPGDADATVRFTTLTRDDGPVRGPAGFTVGVPAGGSATVSLAEVGFTSQDDDFSLVYRADTPVSVSATTQRRGRLAFTQPQTLAATAWFFDQPVIERLRAGELRTEDVLVLNPTATSLDVTVTFRFADGRTLVETERLDPLEVEDVDGRLDLTAMFELPPGGLAFTARVEASGPLVAALEHWDALGLPAGATSLGLPLGAAGPLADVATF